jgi:hypothetical protein
MVTGSRWLSGLVMGIDIEIWIRTKPTDEVMGKLRSLKNERNEDSSCRYPVIDSVWTEKDHIRISSCSRYFGHYYPRGWWPDIRESLLAIKAACPVGTEVEYGGDSSDLDGGILVDDELIADLDAAWAKTGKSL